MKRRICLLLILITAATLLCGCGQGKVNGVNLEIGDSTLYSKEDIQDAMNVVTEDFKENFKGCTLTNLSYDETRSVNMIETWREAYGMVDMIVLFSSFDVDSSGGDGSLSPNSTYDNWMWLLTRTDDRGWVIRNYGY